MDRSNIRLIFTETIIMLHIFRPVCFAQLAYKQTLDEKKKNLRENSVKINQSYRH